MKRKSLRYLQINLLVILGLMMSGLAPTCLPMLAASNGDASPVFMEICTADGLKTIAVDTEDQGEEGDEPFGKPCTHCLTGHMVKLLPTQPVNLFTDEQPRQVALLPLNSSPVLQTRSEHYEPRAPPYAA